MPRHNVWDIKTHFQRSKFWMGLVKWEKWLHLSLQVDNINIKPFATCVKNFNVCSLNTLRLRQNGRHFPDVSFKCIFLNESAWIPIKISLKFVSNGPIDNIPAFVQQMAWRWPGDKPLSEPMVVRLLTQICVTRPQWVKCLNNMSIVPCPQKWILAWLDKYATYGTSKFCWCL